MLVGYEELRQREADGLKEQKMLNGIETQAVVVTAGPKCGSRFATGRSSTAC